MILGTLSQDARQYVQIDENGYINADLLTSYTGDDVNANRLKTLASDSAEILVSLDTEFVCLDKSGNEKTVEMDYQAPEINNDEFKILRYNGEEVMRTGETGKLGATLLPGNQTCENSSNNIAKIVVNKQLSPYGRSEVFSHEGYGHVYLYITLGHDVKNFGHSRAPTLDANGELISYFIPLVGKTLVKLIKPHSSFFIIKVYKYNKPDPIPDLEDRIVVMEKNETEKYLGFVTGHLREKFFFRPDVLFIPICETE